MNGFERRAQLKKKNILEAAITLFSEQGIQKTSIAEIAAKACVSQVTIYKYFENKESLARSVLEYYYDKLLQSFVEVVDSELSFEKKIEEAFFTPMQKRNTAISTFWDETLSEKLRDITMEYEEKVTPHILRFIGQGQACGCFDKNYSAETLIFYLNVFGVNAMKQLENVMPDAKKKQIYEELISIFLYGVAGRH